MHEAGPGSATSGQTRLRVVGAIGILALLLLLVALAGRADHGGLSLGYNSAAGLVVDTTILLLIAADVLMMGAIVWALWDSEPPVAATPIQRRPWILSFVQSLLLLAALWLLLGALRNGGPGGSGAFAGIFHRLQSFAPLALRPGAGSRGFDWAAVGLALSLLAGTGAYLWWRYGRVLMAPTTPHLTGAWPRSPLEAAVEGALLDLASIAEPRQAVIAAYARMERALADHGVARRRSEAPIEYMARVLAAAPGGRAGVERLTGLFEEARFSHHEISQVMRREAIAALEAIRAGLAAAGGRDQALA